MLLRRTVVVVWVIASGCVCGPLPDEFDALRPALDASVQQPVARDAGVPDAGGDAGVTDAGSPDVPDIDVSADPFIDLGDLAYFAGANPPTAAVTRLVVRNVGRAPLFLREPAAGPLGPPSWRVTPLTGGRFEDFCVGRFDEASQTCHGDLRGYDGIRGLLPGEDLELSLRITPNGLGVHAYRVELFSNDPDEPVTQRTVRVNAVMVPPCDVEVSPGGIDFGVLGAGQSLEQAITIRNKLTGPNDVCLVSNIEVSNPAVFELVDTPRMLRVEPGATAQLRVRAQAPATLSAPVPAAAELQFSLANPLLGILRLPLVVTLGERCLRLSPSTADFGATVVGCATPEKSFDLINTCTAPLTLMRASASSTPFLSTQRFAARDQLAPGAVLPDAVRVRYRPLLAGASLGAVSVQVLQGGVPATYVVPVRGEGVAAGPLSERFPAANSKVDVLLVLDDSCSMETLYPSLRSNAMKLLEAGQAAGADYRFAIASTKTDPLLRRTTTGQRWLDPMTPQADVELQHLLSELPGEPFQGCVDAVRRLFQPGAPRTAENSELFRRDAALSVACITDMPEFSPPARFLPEVLDMKPGQRLDRFRYSVMSSFGPTFSGCGGIPPNGLHDAYVAATGGTKEELCTTDWAGALRRMGQASFERHTEYSLAGIPDVSAPIRVFVDGTDWPAVTSGTPQITQWTFDVVKNQLVFNPLTQPQQGSTIKVEYQRVCLQ